MDTESNQSSDNSDKYLSLEDDRQRTGLFSEEEPDNLMPPWSVPPGLLVPPPRQPERAAGQSGAAIPRPAASAPPAEPGDPPRAHQKAVVSATGDPAADDGSWPGVSVNKKRDPSTFVGKLMVDAATAFAALALVEAEAP